MVVPVTEAGIAPADCTGTSFPPQNRLVRSLDPLGQTNIIVYNALGKQEATRDVYGRWTAFVYDALGNLIETVYPDGTVTRSTYDEKNRLVYSQERARTNASGISTALASKNLYDGAGRVIRVERWKEVGLKKQTFTGAVLLSGASAPCEMVLNSAGTSVSMTRTVYDANNRVRYSVDARGAVTEFGYDDAGRRTTTQVYTNANDLVPALDPTAAVSPTGGYALTTFAHDQNGNQVLVRDALGHETTYTMKRATCWLRPVPTGMSPGSNTMNWGGGPNAFCRIIRRKRLPTVRLLKWPGRQPM